MIEKKLAILKAGNVISEKTYQAMQRVLIELEHLGIERNVDTTQVFLTHLAMACERMMNNEGVAHLPEAVLIEMRQNSNYQRAVAYVNNLITSCEVIFVESERNYLFLHMLTILKNQE